MPKAISLTVLIRRESKIVFLKNFLISETNGIEFNLAAYPTDFAVFLHEAF